MKLIASALAALLVAAPAAAEGVLNIYNWSDYIAEDTIARFEAETGIKVTYDVFDSNEMLETKLMAGASGYDLVVPSDNFLARQVAAGVFRPLDKAQIPNLANLNPVIMKRLSKYDPDNAHGAVYMWGTTAFGYNKAKVEALLGAEAPVDSWALIFDEANVAKLAECGVTLLDAPTEVLPAAMNYLGLDPNSTKKADIEAGAALLKKIQPHIRYFHSSQYINDLANGDVCVSMGFSGDIFQAQARAEEAKNGHEIVYVIPEEGSLMWFDMMAIPADAKNVEAAHKFIDFILRPETTAGVSNYVMYANANDKATPLVDPAVTGNPGIYPPAEVLAKLWSGVVYDAKTDRVLNRAWTAVKAGR